MGEQQATVLVVVAHPDDESFGCGGVIALAAQAGHRVVVCSATRGEAGVDTTGRLTDPVALGAAREAELRAAARHLGAFEVEVLGFADSGWDGPAPSGALVERCDEAVAAIAALLRRQRPDVVVTMDPTGSDGHRDHAMVGAATTAAFHQAVDWPSSLYHWCLARSLMRRWAAATASGDPDSVYLDVDLGRPDEHLTTVLDASAVLDRRRAAMAAHATQSSPYDGLDEELVLAFLTREHLVRVIPPWSGGAPERALRLP